MATPANSQNRDERGLAEQLEGALDWWRDAGVDGKFANDPVDRFAEAETEKAKEKEKAAPAQPAPVPVAKVKPKPAPSAPLAKVAGDEEWPKSLDAFAPWWLEEGSVEIGGTGPRIAPRGSSNAELMVLVSQPEADDRETLLNGLQGKLLSGFLRAAGIASEDCYVACVLPRVVALPDWEALQQAKLGALTAHHVSLAAPERLLVFGRNVLPLIGHDQAQGAHMLGESHGMKSELSVLAAPGLEELLRSAPRRKRLWQDWLDWTA